MTLRVLVWWLFIITVYFNNVSAVFNRSLFFRSSSYWDEPRFERPWLTTFDIQLLGGGNHLSKNGCKERTPLLALYGPENIAALSRVLPDHPLTLPRNHQKNAYY